MNRRLVFNIFMILLIVSSLFAPSGQQPAAQAAGTLLSVNFNSSTDGFNYADDAFGTSQPNYASGVRTTSGGYGSTGGLQVSLGGVDATAITGMSGAWTYTLSLGAAESGVLLSFRYKLEQTATYEYDEYSRVMVKVDGIQYGRGVKNYVDHVSGDGHSGTGDGTGNRNVFIPTTGWQQHQVYLGDLGTGAHTIVLGGYNHKKNAADETTTLVLDDVVVTSGNPALTTSDAQELVNRVSQAEYLSHIQGVAQFRDRCRASGMGCSSTDYTTNYMNAVAWLETELQALGYTTVRHNSSANGTSTTNLWATKLGTVTPTQMYMVSTHLDGRSGGDAFDDDGSGVAVVLEAARVFAGSDVTTDKSIRFIFWDKEEIGYKGADNYVRDRRSLQGTVNEPTWLGLITHDMVLYDHGVGSGGSSQSVYADLDVEWRAGTTKEADSMVLANQWRYFNGTYSTNYPASAWNYSYYTDDGPFWPYVASVSVRENRRIIDGSVTDEEWINPYYHTVNDIEARYSVDDIRLGYNAAQATIGTLAELAGVHVGQPNTPPTANPQSVSTNEDTATAITLTGSDPDSDPLTYAVVANPGHGTLSGTAPNLTYTPAANYNGPDSFTFKVNDGTVDSSPATVSITVNPVNDAPIANPQSVSTNEDTARAITLSGSDVDGNPLTYSVVVGPGHGSLSGTAPNVTYTPSANYNGTDSFTFKVNDSTVDSAPATVSISVTPVNDSPVANAQSLSTAEDTPLGILLSGSDVENSPLSFAVVATPAHGSLSGSAPNLTYTPDLNYHGADSFTFKVNDGSVDSTPATVSLAITPLNDAPVVNSQAVSTAQDTPLAITLTGSDVDGDALSFSVASGPANGTLSGTAPDLLYTPGSGYQGADSFTFTASDGQATSAPATVEISVTRVNNAPTAADQAVSTAEDTSLAITLSGSDLDSDPLTFAVLTAPANGVLSGAAPDLTYTPNPNFNGSDSFTFKANDGLADSAPATVSISVTPVNDAPQANAQSVNLAEDSPVAITLSGSDVDGDALTFTIVDPPMHGALSGAAPNLTYTPVADYNGPDSFAFRVNDGALDSAVATVSISVTPVNDVAVVYVAYVTTNEDTSTAVTLTGSDLDGDVLTFAVADQPAHGSLSGVAPNLTYLPAANYNGADSFTFVANDGTLNSAPATVYLTVTPVNDAPVANPQTVSTQQDSALAITLNGSDVDGDALAFSVVSGPANGALAGTPPNLTYTPNAGYIGSDSFTFVTNDGQVDSAGASVSITVVASGPYLYLGSSTSGTAGGVAFADEDILVKNQGSGAWQLYFDGSDVGLSGTDVDAFELQTDGSLLMSFDSDFSLSGFATVDDSDILRFVPTSLGATTAGAWQWYFDGSDVGLSTSDEDVDAFTLLPDGRLLVSTLGSVSVTGASGADEDLLVFTPTQLGSTTSGTWAMYFDGSDVGLSSTSNEDVNGVWVDTAGKIYLTTLGSFSVTGVSGDGSDIFTCTASSLGSTTACTFAMYWDGSNNGFSGEDTDSIGIVP